MKTTRDLHMTGLLIITITTLFLLLFILAVGLTPQQKLPYFVFWLTCKDLLMLNIYQTAIAISYLYRASVTRLN